MQTHIVVAVIAIILFSSAGRAADAASDCTSTEVTDGCGTLSFPDGTKYVGGFRGEQPSGHGTITFGDGSVMSGDFSELGAVQNPTYTKLDGTKFSGEYKPSLTDLRVPRKPLHFPFWRALAKDSASILVYFVVDETGKVVSAHIANPTGKSFDESVLEGVKQWRYIPATIGGHPVKDIAGARVEFSD
ncbi:MAG TPA: TonB family protein [Rhizomicrobium sp.]|jgi:TonB family protein